MNIVNIEASQLADYIRAQIRNLFPLPNASSLSAIDVCLPQALARTEHCLSQVRMWKPGQLDVLHSSQYCIFLYYLANTVWQRERDSASCTLLFLLNKALNGIDLFYEIEMPEVFFIGHSVGIVLAKAHYSNYLVLYQNSTVGKNHGNAPRLEEGVVMFPNTAIIGDCLVRRGSVIAQGVSVINQETQENALVFQGQASRLVFKPAQRNILADIFRLDTK